MTLNITKPEAECLSRMVERYMKADMSSDAVAHKFQYACLPLLDAIKVKIDKLANEPEKVSQIKQAIPEKKKIKSMRGNLVYKSYPIRSVVEFVEDENGEYEVVDGGRITQHQNDGWYENELEKFRKDFNLLQVKQDDNFWNDERVIEFVTTMKMKNCSLSDIHEFKRRDSITNPNRKQAKQSQVESNPEKEVLFTTEDGVKIYSEDERYYVVITKEGFGYEPYSVAWLANGDIYSANYKDACKVFSTKENAEEWLVLNKPILSVQDVIGLQGKHNLNGWIYFNDLERLMSEVVKEKMKA